MGSKSKKKITVGYWYLWDLLMGLCRGPVNEIVEIRIDDKQAWAGKLGEAIKSITLYVRKRKLFGGDDVGGEGGIDGYIEVAMGEPDQLPSNSVKNLVRGIVPAFRGVVTVFYSGFISAFNAYPKKWKFRLRRSTKGWHQEQVWYPEKATIMLRNDNALIHVTTNERRISLWGTVVPGLEPEYAVDVPSVTENLRQIHAMNPAHILIQAATDKALGGKLNFSDIDIDSYKVAADTLYDEGFGLCIRYDSAQTNVKALVRQVLDHIGAAQFASSETGKMKLRLIRNDYDPDALPVFNYDSGILSVQDADGTSIDTAINHMTVVFHDPVTDSDGDVTYQNLAAIQAHGAIADRREYLALPTFELAARVAQRDLSMTASGLKRLTLRFDRRGGQLEPGSCFRVNLPDIGINNMILRVGEEPKENENGEITITAIQDLFGLPSTSYGVENPPIEWVPADTTPYPVNLAQLLETPYFMLAGMLSAAELQYISSDAGFLGVVSVAPTTLSINYELQTRPAGDEFKPGNTGDWTHKASLINDITPHQDKFIVTGEVITVFPAAAMIDDEIINITHIDVTTGEVTAERGCADSIPKKHDEDAVIWYLESVETDAVEYTAGEIVDARLLTNTSTGQLDADDAPIISIKMTQRQFRPYPPGNVLLNGAPWYEDVLELEPGETFTLTWAHRDRVMQADTLFGHQVGSIGPEPGTTYLVVYLLNGFEIAIKEVDGDNYTYSQAEQPFNSFDSIHLYSVRSGLRSMMSYEITVNWIIPEIRFIFSADDFTPPPSDALEFIFEE